eukprot:evm.model.scf_37.8 EVM.evm.TU.scf_37.8   scf_37:59297-67524(+)
MHPSPMSPAHIRSHMRSPVPWGYKGWRWGCGRLSRRAQHPPAALPRLGLELQPPAAMAPARAGARVLLALAYALALFADAGAKMVWDDLMYANTNIERHQVLYSASVNIDGVEVPSKYVLLLRSGDEDPSGSGEVWGQQYDREGNKIYEINNVTFGKADALEISTDQDFTSILQVGSKLFSVAHFENLLPAITYLAELSQGEDGELSIVSFEAMDWTEFEGVWKPCAGSVTPWQTHLGSEESSPNARDMTVKNQKEWDALKLSEYGDSANDTEEFMRWYGKYPNELTFNFIKENFNPYRYGYPWEAKVAEDGTYTVVKHFSMGKTSIELPFVMPDNKTVYIMNDGTNHVLTVYVADEPNDLTSGTLYAAKVIQKSNVDGGLFDVEWIDMGSATDDEIKEMIESLTFADLFEYAAPNTTDYPDNKGCPEGFNSINVGDEHECLILKEGREKAASRLETRRYAALNGATTEWSKMEGFTYSPLRRRAYMAMSQVREGMENNTRKGKKGDDRHDVGGGNHIQLPYNPCGCVYQIDLDEKWFATQILSLICGKPDLTPGIPDFMVCDVNGIANPDNIAIVSEHDGLIMGEDTELHRNDVIWYLDLKTRELQRILSAPYGSETTSPYYYGDINGWSYIMGVVQSPYEDTDLDKVFEPQSTGLGGWFGYIGPFPVARA